MKNITILKIFIVAISIQSFGQNHTYLSFELAGSGGFGSVNFERSFHKKESFELDYRIGLSFAPIDKNNGTAIVFPLMIHGVYGKNSHKIDLGIGQAFTLTTRLQLFLKTPVSIG